MNRRVVITGLGPLTAESRGREAFRDLLLSCPRVANGHPRSPRLVPDLEPDGADRRLRHVDRLGRLALAAARLGIEDAGLEGSAELQQMGVTVGSGFGCLATNVEYLRGILSKGPRLGNPIVFQNTVSNAAAGYVSAVWKLCGPTGTFCSGSLAGLEALNLATYNIAEGGCDGMLVIAAEELSPWLKESFAVGGELSQEGIGRPLDRRRDGVVLAEGACALVVESLAQAERRGARIYAEVSIPDRVDREGAADFGAEPLGIIFTGASGSRARDRQEADALLQLMGESAADVPVSCPKGALGETVGASGGFSIAAAALALWSGEVPPTVNLVEPDPEIPFRPVLGGSLALQSPTALVSALGESGGTLTTLLRGWAA